MKLGNKYSTAIVFLILFLLPSSNSVAIASGSGLGGVIYFWRNSSNDTGRREIIDLNLKGDVLFGRSKTSKRIRMITVQAPGIKESRVILRELASADGTLTFVFSGPKSLAEKFCRMAVYCYHPYGQYRLIRYANGTFKSYESTILPAPETELIKGSRDNLKAFVIDSLGMYWVVDNIQDEESQQVLPANHSSPTAPLDGGLYRGLLPLTTAILLLLIGSVVSYCSHRIDYRVRI